jgi:hypothetical protein
VEGSPAFARRSLFHHQSDKFAGDDINGQNSSIYSISTTVFIGHFLANFLQIASF